MKLPKVGEVIYGFHWEHGRIGELEFMTSTQGCACKTRKTLEREIKSTEEDERESPEDVYIPIRYALVRLS